GFIPVSHHSSNQPSRQPLRSFRDRRIIDSRLKQQVRESNRACNIIRSTAVASEALIPVEAFGAGLNRRANIAKPQWPPGAVPQQMRAKNAKVVLLAEHSEF